MRKLNGIFVTQNVLTVLLNEGKALKYILNVIQPNILNSTETMKRRVKS